MALAAAAMMLLTSCGPTTVSTTFGPVSAGHFEYSEEGRVAIASYSVSAITKEVMESGAVTGALDFGKDRGAWYAFPSFFHPPGPVGQRDRPLRGRRLRAGGGGKERAGREDGGGGAGRELRQGGGDSALTPACLTGAVLVRDGGWLQCTLYRRATRRDSDAQPSDEG